MSVQLYISEEMREQAEERSDKNVPTVKQDFPWQGATAWAWLDRSFYQDQRGWKDECGWKDEPDKIVWRDEQTGLDCMMQRSILHGSWCGYVGVKRGHPCFKKDCSEAEQLMDKADGWEGVHGGLTYSAPCEEADGVIHEAKMLCHPSDDHDSDPTWWLGFDTAHFRDFTPNMSKDMPGFSRQENLVYRDVSYVKAECVALAAALGRSESV